MQRCLLDIDNQYALVGYDNLSQEHETLIISKIEESLRNNSNKMKLCFVGLQTANRLYRFFLKRMNVTKLVETSRKGMS
jgi:hypothetical protein